MDDDRRDLIRRMFSALTVLTECAGNDAVEGQAPSIDAETSHRLANKISDAAQIIGIVSDAITALLGGPSAA